VFEASAMMEYHWNKEPAVATKVFDLGLKSFSEDVNYVLQYLDFLITLNDDSSWSPLNYLPPLSVSSKSADLLSISDHSIIDARALFEKTVSKIPPESARPLWRRWAAYEFIYGDKAASEKLNLRVAEIFPDCKKILNHYYTHTKNMSSNCLPLSDIFPWPKITGGVVERLSDRHAYTDLGDVLGRELGTAIEPIPLRNRSPSPVPAHLGGFVSKRAGGGPPDVGHHPTGIPSGPASYRNRQQQHHQRERSFSPDFRGKRPRGARSSVSPDRRNGPSSTGIPTAPSASDSNPSAKRGRDNYENNPKRNRYSSPPSRNRDTPPPAPNPYAWFPEGLRYFLGILPLATSFEGTPTAFFFFCLDN
jgi:cleavage stimulation factor subunit 3